jgi:hypothetical protein
MEQKSVYKKGRIKFKQYLKVIVEKMPDPVKNKRMCKGRNSADVNDIIFLRPADSLQIKQPY